MPLPTELKVYIDLDRQHDHMYNRLKFCHLCLNFNYYQKK